MDITAKVVEIFPTDQISDRFRKREMVVEYATNPQYPEYVKFEFVQDRVDLLDNLQPGQEVQVWFDLRGRKWASPTGTRYFNTLQGWRVQAKLSAAPEVTQEVTPEVAGEVAGEVDEIPF